MSDYAKLTDFTAKDSLVTGDPEKIALGADIDADLSAIVTMSATKEDSANKNAANGYCGLDSGGLVLRSDLPAATSYTDTSEVYTAGKGTTVVVLTDGANIAMDCEDGNVFTVTLAGNRTLDAPSNPIDGQTISLYVTQDAEGSRTLTWANTFDFPGGTPPTLTTGAAAVDMFTMQYRATPDKWYVVTSGLNFS
jgi:hypothetical protein